MLFAPPEGGHLVPGACRPAAGVASLPLVAPSVLHPPSGSAVVTAPILTRHLSQGHPPHGGAAGAIAHPFGAGWVGLCAPTLTVALPTPHMALGALLRAPPPRERSRPSVVPYQRGNARVLVGYQK